jgi:hypothetical protein
MPPAAPTLHLLGAFHTDNGGLNFQSTSSDDYVGCRVDAKGADLSLNAVQPEVSGYGTQPVFVGFVDGAWQVNFKLPPGLSSGWHQVRLRVSETVSNPVEIAVDLPLLTTSLNIASVCDGVNWQPLQVSLNNGFASLWVHGLPRNADRNNVKVNIAGKRQATTFVGSPGPDGPTQVNVRLRANTPEGKQALDVQFGDVRTPPVAIEITP